eukprot:m.256425 g.256425  ORF g.256425 m.256425 type:complete len:108 (-) comp15521_c0_seq1:51-374(-)
MGQCGNKMLALMTYYEDVLPAASFLRGSLGFHYKSMCAKSDEGYLCADELEGLTTGFQDDLSFTVGLDSFVMCTRRAGRLCWREMLLLMCAMRQKLLSVEHDMLFDR